MRDKSQGWITDPGNCALQYVYAIFAIDYGGGHDQPTTQPWFLGEESIGQLNYNYIVAYQGGGVSCQITIWADTLTTSTIKLVSAKMVFTGGPIYLTCDIFINWEAREIIPLVASVCQSVRLPVLSYLTSLGHMVWRCLFSEARTNTDATKTFSTLPPSQ